MPTDIIKLALKEDIDKGDITTSAIVPKDLIVKAKIIVKEKGVIAGLNIAKDILKTLDSKIIFIKKVPEGKLVKKGKVLAIIKGKASTILTLERTVLNFLQRLSGIATLTYKFNKKIKSSKVKLLDTRKTTPLMRKFEKYAVKTGGGVNHRFGLYDRILIKDNHIKIAGSITEAVKRVRKKYGKKIFIEVETSSLNQVKEAISRKVNRVMLDNMNVQTIKKAVKLINEFRPYIEGRGNRIEIEVSGGINLKNINKIAKTGVDFISAGEITHSPKALDISMEIL